MQSKSTRSLNPLLVKEFRSRMRTIKTPLILVLYLLAIGGITFAYTYLQHSSMNYFSPNQSKTLFMMLAALQLVLIAFVAPGLTASTISGERERQTLNILLTTHLSPTKIVLSKLAASLSFMALLVFSTLPVYALIFLYGGIAPAQVVEVFAFYLMAMLLFGSIGMFCSAFFKRTGVSTVSAYGLTFTLLGGTLLLVFFLVKYLDMRANANVPHPSLFYAAALNPLLNLVSIFEPDAVMIKSGGNPPIPSSLYFLIVYLPVSALLLWASIRLLEPVKRSRFGRGGQGSAAGEESQA
jgi:ABC-2 type transport system permease protein